MIAIVVIWTFTGLYIHFQKFFNSGIGALLFVRGAAYMLGGFPNEAYLLKKVAYPELIDPVQEKLMPQCSLKICWSFYCYITLFIVLIVLRVVFRSKFGKLDFFQRFDKAVIAMYEPLVKEKMDEGIKEAMLNPKPKNKVKSKHNKQDSSDEETGLSFADLMKNAKKEGGQHQATTRK